MGKPFGEFHPLWGEMWLAVQQETCINHPQVMAKWWVVMDDDDNEVVF